MGWNKQSGDSWVLQRTVDAPNGHTNVKMLQLRVIGLLTIEDADRLMRALHGEIVAARKSEGNRFPVETLETMAAREESRIDYGPQFGEDEDG